MDFGGADRTIIAGDGAPGTLRGAVIHPSQSPNPFLHGMRGFEQLPRHLCMAVSFFERSERSASSKVRVFRIKTGIFSKKDVQKTAEAEVACREKKSDFSRFYRPF